MDKVNTPCQIRKESEEKPRIFPGSASKTFIMSTKVAQRALTGVLPAASA
jgi:hypothetical protein